MHANKHSGSSALELVGLSEATDPEGYMDTGGFIRDHARDQRRRGLEESTIGNRSRMVRHLAEWLGKSLLDATSEDVESFLDSKKLCRKTRYTYISNLHVFYVWAIRAGHTEHDPTLAIIRPRAKPGLPRPISDSELQEALASARGDIKVILTLAAYQGLRCIEISRLVRADVLDNRKPPMIMAHGKGDRSRVIPLHTNALAALRQLPMPRSGPILRWPDGRPLQPWKVSALGNEYLHALGIDATMHRLRHWFGTTLYQTSGRDLLLVRDLMGHSSITTTTIYAAFDKRGALEAVSALDPEKGEPPLTVA